MASSTNKSLSGWKTNGKSWESDTSKTLSGYTPNSLNLSLSNPNPSTNSWNAGRLAACVPYQTHDDTTPENGSRSWNDNGNKTRLVNAKFRTNGGGRMNSPKLSSTGHVPQNHNHPVNQDVDSQQGHAPSFDSRKRAESNTIPATNECDNRMEYKPNKANGSQYDGVSAQTNSHRFGRNNWTSDRPKKFRRPLTNPYSPNNQSTHIAVKVRKVAPHAEDLQPNEGFTGVKTTIAPGVPKVLSTSTSTSRIGLGSKNGNALRGATNLRRGNWAGKRGNRRGPNLPTKSTQPMQPVRPSFPPLNLPLSNPPHHDSPHHDSPRHDSPRHDSPRHDPPTPHRLPPVALNKTLKSYKLIPQKRRNQPSPDSVASLSSSSSMSISSPSSESSAPREYRKKDFSHLLPGGPWKTKRRKVQEQELRQDDLEQHVMNIVSEEIPVREDLVDNDGSVEGAKSISNGGRVDGPADGTDNNLLQRNTTAEKVGLESSEYDYELVYPPSSPVPSRPLSNASRTTSKAQINASKETPRQSCSGATEIKDEPLDDELADLAPSNNRTSGTERYHPIPPSCLKFYYSSSVNSLFPETDPSSSKSNPNTNQTSRSRLVPNPHYNTARSEYTRRAIDELRAKGMIARRALWRDDGLCIDWEKAAVRENAGDAEAGGGKNNVKGKERTSDSQTRKRKDARGQEAPKSMGATFDDLFLLADNNVRVKSEPHPDPRLPDEPKKSQSNQSMNSQLKEPKFSPSDVDIIDLTIDEEPSIPSIPNPPQTNSFPNIERQENDVVKSANDRPMYQPPLLVRLGSGRTPSQDSSRSGMGHPEPTFRHLIPPTPSLFNSSGLPLNPHLIHDDPSIRSLSMHAPPVIQTTLPTAKTLTNIEEVNVGEAQGSNFTGADDSGDTEEERQVRDELGLDPELNDPDHLIKSVELPKFETDSSIRHPPRVEAAQTSSEETEGYRYPSLHRSPTTVVDMDEKAKMERGAIDFLRRYINSWEYDRASLARAYAPNAVFSCTVILPETSSGISIDKSPTHAFASHFATSMSAFNPNSFTSSRRLRGPPVPIQTPTVITPALLLLDPQRAYTFFPRGGQAEVAYDVLYLGNLGNSPEEGAKSGRSDVLVYLGVQAELKRKMAEPTDDEIWDMLNAENILDLLDPKIDKKGKGKVDEAKLCIGWNFVLCAGGEGEDKFSLQIVSHQMMIRDGA
ncbi:hypothetical protein F5050DRAFT_1742436 [Lentinula boryana]|uniref:NTF2 domain-containing protein n=1 Tax=Lentinula boryana TaxID=40481 RepID=A0ABQ8QJY1_9AGAR|nr:hypothetical protein F5050DRAFT_1742436 [Lentinula boryana]